MHSDILNKLKHFKRVNAPKYIEAKIQKIALSHLNLSDMGKLRDRFDGQLYYDKLKTDIIAEFAFENFIGIKKFDWSKREIKNYKRKYYTFDHKELNIITVTKARLPKINPDVISNTIFIYVNIDNRVYISGVATKSLLLNYTSNSTNRLVEFNSFEILSEFNSVEQLIQILE